MKKNIHSKKILSIIPARGGSKRIPRKNLIEFGGIPLIGHSIFHSIKSSLISKTIVSSDDEEILNYSKTFDNVIALKRPKNISGDKSTSEEVVLHALNNMLDKKNYDPDLVVLIQPTSPIRSKGVIDNAIEKFINKEADSMLSVTKNHQFLWTESASGITPVNYSYNKRPMSQKFNNQYLENGSFYIFKPWLINKFNCRLGGNIEIFEMDYWSSFEIDNYEDYLLCKFIFKEFFNRKL